MRIATAGHQTRRSEQPRYAGKPKTSLKVAGHQRLEIAPFHRALVQEIKANRLLELGNRFVAINRGHAMYYTHWSDKVIICATTGRSREDILTGYNYATRRIATICPQTGAVIGSTLNMRTLTDIISGLQKAKIHVCSYRN